MTKSDRRKFTLTILLLLLFFMLGGGGLGYWNFSLQENNSALRKELNQTNSKLARSEAELINLMTILDSSSDEKKKNNKTSSTDNLDQLGANSEEISADDESEDLDIEAVLDYEKAALVLNDDSTPKKDDHLIEDTNNLKPTDTDEGVVEVVEKIDSSGTSVDISKITAKPEKVLEFAGKKLHKGTSVNLAVQFAPNSDYLTESAELLALTDFLKEHPKIIIRLSGHTEPNPPKDSSAYEPTAEMHLQLSKRRVESVARFLIGQGIPSAQIETAYFGGSRPKYNNPRLNRRVEMEVIRDN